MMNTREEMQAWALSLKPGDNVVLCGWRNTPEKILTVKKVTPSGIVRTDDGSYKQRDCGTRIYGIGSSCGYIEPSTDENSRKAYAEMERVAAERRAKRTIEAAKNVCYELRYGIRDMTYEIALKIIEIVGEKSTREGADNG